MAYASDIFTLPPSPSENLLIVILLMSFHSNLIQQTVVSTLEALYQKIKGPLLAKYFLTCMKIILLMEKITHDIVHLIRMDGNLQRLLNFNSLFRRQNVMTQ